MKVYDPVVVGWGLDWWYMDVLSPGIEGKVAIVDEISCINPVDRTKGGQREIDLLQSTPERVKNWKRIREQYNIRSHASGLMEFGAIKSPLGFSSIFRAFKIILIQVICKLGRNEQNLVS